MKQAKQIAELIIDMDTDVRGQLFFEIAEELLLKSQYYTASLFNKIALECGYDAQESALKSEG